ncbi:MAG: hypothetical protein KUG73_00640, partial [Pseudomonadales bacterium]|nr:hypothetical protein [Pseudomonadales bacterium]
MKTKLVAMVVGSILFAGHTGAAVIGHANLDGVVYFADDDASSTLLRYEVASEASLNSVSLDGTPTAIEADNLGVYVGLGQSLYRYTFPSGVATRQLLRHFPKDIKAIKAVEGYLLVVTGNPSQTVTVINRLDGSLKNATVFEEDKFGIISGLHYSADNGYIIINFTAEVDGTVFLTATFDTDNATFGAFEASAVNKFSTPFFFEGAKVIVGQAGELVQFGTTGV